MVERDSTQARVSAKAMARHKLVRKLKTFWLENMTR